MFPTVSSRRLLWGSFFAFNLAVYAFLRPVFLNPDGIQYFAYLVSIFDKHTLSFVDIYQHFNLAIPLTVSSQGWLANMGAVGSALLWVPFLWAADLYLAMDGAVSAYVIDTTRLVFVNFGNMVLGVASLVLLYFSIKRLDLKGPRLAICLLTLFGTPLFYYTFIMGSTSHPTAAFASALCLWYGLETRNNTVGERNHAVRWFILGLLGGFATSVRTQEGLVLVPAALEWIWRLRENDEERGSLLCGAGLLGVGFAIGFLPQALVWQAMEGSFVKSPEVQSVSLDQYKLISTLFSPYHGLFTWTPLYVAALAGYIWRALRRDIVAIGLGLVLLGQMLVLGLGVAWWEGYSFGMRLMTGATLAAGMGVAYFIDELSALPDRRWLGAGLTGVILCGVWSLLLSMQSYAGSADLLLYVNPFDIVREFGSGWSQFLPLAANALPELRLFIILVPLEILAAGWLYGCLKRPGSVLGGSVLLLAIFSSAQIYHAGLAPKPDLSHAVLLSEAELGAFYKAEAYHCMGLYDAMTGNPARAQRWFNRADMTVPRVPTTQPYTANWETQRRQRMMR